MMASNDAISIHYHDLWLIDFSKIRNINFSFSFSFSFMLLLSIFAYNLDYIYE